MQIKKVNYHLSCSVLIGENLIIKCPRDLVKFKLRYNIRYLKSAQDIEHFVMFAIYRLEITFFGCVNHLTIILRNRAECRLILSRRGRRRKKETCNI